MAWDVTGHRIVGEVAEFFLQPEVKKQILQLTAGKSLAQISTWADEIKTDPHWVSTKNWHYLNVPAGTPLTSVLLQTHHSLLWAIHSLVESMRTGHPMTDGPLILSREEELAFLVHLVGDLHQPLHLGYASDEGGNQKKVIWFGVPTQLHRVWDELMVEQKKLTYSEFAHFLMAKKEIWMKNESTHYEGDATLLSWAHETRGLLDSVYRVGPTGELNEDYFSAHLPEVEKQLFFGGYRLAILLNTLY